MHHEYPQMDGYHGHYHHRDANATYDYQPIDQSEYYFIFIALYLVVSAQVFTLIYIMIKICRERRRRRDMVVILETLEMTEEEVERMRNI